MQEQLSIEKFNPLKKEVTDLVEACKKTVVSIKDNKSIDGYNLMKENKSKLQKKRTKIITTLKEERSHALAYQKLIISFEKDLIAIIDPLETELADKIKAIDKAKEIEKRKELLPTRKESLSEIELEVSDKELLEMNDIQFITFLNDKKAEYFEEKERLAEEKLQEEQRKLKEEQRKLKEEQDKIEKEKRKLEEEKRIIEERKQAIRDAEIAKKQAEKDEEDRKKKEQEELEKKKKYQKFLADNGYNEKTKEDFNILTENNKVILYKKIATYEL